MKAVARNRSRGWVLAARAGLALLLAVGIGAFGAPTAGAKKRRNLATSEWGYKTLTAAHEALAGERFDEALALMKKMSERKSLNDHEKALMWQTLAYIQSAKEQYGAAIESFEKCLALDALPDAAALATEYNLGQLFMSEHRYQDAVRVLEGWIGKVENPSAHAYYLIAMGHVQLQDAESALPYAIKAVEASKEPSEPELRLLLALRFELKQYEEVAKLLEELISHFPKKIYFLQLSAAYAELGLDKRSLSTLELAYLQGLLDRESELLNLAQAYLYHELPYPAARVLAKGLEDGVITDGAENWRLLGDSWLHAREYGQALVPLQRAAALSGDGNLFVRIAQVHLERDEPKAALEALQKALNKGRLDNPGNAYLLLGITLAGSQDFGAAREAFAKASGYEKSREAAEKWIQHVARQEAVQ